MTAKKKKENFEDMLSKLEVTVENLEQDNVSLEDSLKYFEEGVHLVKECTKVLRDAERKVEILLSEDGKDETVADFTLDDSE